MKLKAEAFFSCSEIIWNWGFFFKKHEGINFVSGSIYNIRKEQLCDFCKLPESETFTDYKASDFVPLSRNK